MMSGLVELTLYPEKYIRVKNGDNIVTILFEVVLGFGVSLIILKFLKKGFECYVLWTDGDPDTEPVGLVIRFIEAIAVAVCFPTLYKWLAEVTHGLSKELLTTIGEGTAIDWQSWVAGVCSLGLTNAIIGLIFIICYITLFFQFLTRGLEIMIMRIGLPMACVGLLDNDKGVFRTYINKFFQSTVTVIIQICLCRLGIGLIAHLGANFNLFWGIACIVMAIKTPTFLRDFLVTAGSSGGSVINNVYHSVRLIGMAKKFIK
jgi:hypothetical protein